jgi:hypothetical protein
MGVRLPPEGLRELREMREFGCCKSNRDAEERALSLLSRFMRQRPTAPMPERADTSMGCGDFWRGATNAIPFAVQPVEASVKSY